MLTFKHTTFIVCLLLLAILREAFTLPLELSSDALQIDRQAAEEGGHLSPEDYENALDPKFVDTKTLHDEDEDSNLFEGDIEGNDEAVRFDRIVVANREVVNGRKWPKKNGIVSVPFTFPSGLDSTTKAEIARVVKEYKDKTCIRLIERTTEENYVWLKTDGSGCSSRLGMEGGPQRIKHSPSCSWGNLAHEFMHALGFFHEHTRSDRDKYVTIKWGNIPSDWAHNFKKCTERGCNDLQVGYDYGSVMHYGGYLLGKEAIVPKDPNARIGQRQALSPKDLIGLNEHYGCGSVTPPTTQAPPSGNWNKLEKKHCWSEKLAGSYTTVEAAQLACSSNSACTGVYDQGCDAEPNDIYLCGAVPNGYTESGFSCIYEKPKVTYVKLEKKHCWEEKYGKYNTVADAKGACSSDAACTGVYDAGCNAEADSIYLCGAVPNGYTTSRSSCVYQKQG